MKLLLNLAVILILSCSAQAQDHERIDFEGSLSSGDQTLESGQWYDVFHFDALKGQKVVVRMESSDFDTYLYLNSPSGNSWDNDDYEGESVSQLEVIATEAGEYEIWASSYTSDMGGTYYIVVELGEVAEIVTIQGRLDHADTQALKGEYFDSHVFEITTDVQVQVELMSLGFDGYLIVTSPSGSVWRNDDAGSTSISRIGPVAGEQGKWRVDVTTVSEGEVGAYDVIVSKIPNSM